MKKCVVILLICLNPIYQITAQIYTSGTYSTECNFKFGSTHFDFHNITDRDNGFILQSNACPQQLWLDLNHPGFLHAIFTNSQFKDPPYPDRTCLYFGSTDAGVTWYELGPVPDTSRSGFPAIHGTIDGAAVIVNHNDYFSTTTHSSLFIDLSPFHNSFSAFDPGTQPQTMWPRCLVLPDSNILIVASAQQNIAFNLFKIDSNSFLGWSSGAMVKPESYSIVTSEGGKIGFTYISDDFDNKGDVFYIESNDGGITWSTLLKIFDCPAEQGIAVGALRGINLNFYGEEPCVVFEVCQQDFNSASYFSRLPNEILFWSPNVNGGNPKVIADSNNVPFAPSLNPEGVFPPLCRPVLSRSQEYNLLFIAFDVATDSVHIDSDSTSYFAGYFMYSTDGGNYWAEPDKFTPEWPLLDWKYISIAPINPVVEDNIMVFIVLQGESLELKPNPSLLSAQYYCAVNSQLFYTSAENLSTITDSRLLQNYPNPFNPNTKIEYQIPELSFVTIKVYDVLGNEVATLVNIEKPAGSYEVTLYANELPSGVYFYQLRAGDFAETKKMVLMK